MSQSQRPQAFSAVRLDDTIWVTRDDRNVLINEMDNIHLFATVRLLRRSGAIVPTLMQLRYEVIIEAHPEYLL